MTRLKLTSETQKVAELWSSARYAYDGRPDRPDGVPDGARVEWEVELIDFDRQVNWADAGPDEMIRRATQLREQVSP